MSTTTDRDPGNCSNAFKQSPEISIPIFICFVLYFCALLGITVAWVITYIRKKNPETRALAGWLFGISVVCHAVAYLTHVTMFLLSECGHHFLSLYRASIAFVLFDRISVFALLFLILHSLPSVLFGRLSLTRNVSKLVTLVVLGLMGALTIVVIVIGCYVEWVISDLRRWSRSGIVDVEPRLSIAFWILYLFSVFLGIGFVVSSVVVARTRRVVDTRTITFITAIFISMVGWVAIRVALDGSRVSNTRWEYPTLIGLQYVMGLFMILTYSLVLHVARSRKVEDGVVVEEDKSVRSGEERITA